MLKLLSRTNLDEKAAKGRGDFDQGRWNPIRTHFASLLGLIYYKA